jgi:homoserine kinase type II
VNVLDAGTLARVAEAFGIGPVTHCWATSRGIENRNFFIATGYDGISREYVLTIMEQAASAGRQLVPLLTACRALGLPVAAPLPTQDGHAELWLDGKPALLCPRLPGRHPLNPTAPQVAAVGRFLARLHSGTSNLAALLPAYPRAADWLRTQGAACQPFLSFQRQRLMAHAVAAAGGLLQRRDVQALPTGAIHGDLFRDNALFNAWGLSGVLDFHHASSGYLIYDLAVVANDWCIDPLSGRMQQGHLLALLAAYHRIRPLEPRELGFLPLFALYAALAFWQSRLVVALARARGEADRANDPEDFERIVSCHLNDPVRLDAELIYQNVAARDR